MDKKNLADIPSDYVVFDLETTGFSPEYAEIIEIGAVRVKKGKVTDRYQSYVKPRKGIPSNITALTGITQKDTACAPYIEDAIEDFLDFIGDDVLIAHNASFDCRFVCTVCLILGKKFDNIVLDSIKIAKKYIVSKSSKLEVLKEKLGIKMRSHNAIDDCTVTHMVIEHCRDIDKLSCN